MSFFKIDGEEYEVTCTDHGGEGYSVIIEGQDSTEFEGVTSPSPPIKTKSKQQLWFWVFVAGWSIGFFGFTALIVWALFLLIMGSNLKE